MQEHKLELHVRHFSSSREGHVSYLSSLLRGKKGRTAWETFNKCFDFLWKNWLNPGCKVISNIVLCLIYILSEFFSFQFSHSDVIQCYLIVFAFQDSPTPEIISFYSAMKQKSLLHLHPIPVVSLAGGRLHQVTYLSVCVWHHWWPKL